MNDSFFDGYEFGIDHFLWNPMQIVFCYMQIFISKLSRCYFYNFHSIHKSNKSPLAYMIIVSM